MIELERKKGNTCKVLRVWKFDQNKKYEGIEKK